MAKISLNKLNLDKTPEVKKIDINRQEVEVLQYLPVKEKIKLLKLAIEESFVGGYCNPVLVDALFHTYVVLSYTNISLTPTQKENILETYDILEKSGLIGEIVNSIPCEEYNAIRESLYECIEVSEKEANSIISLITGTIDRLADSFETSKEKLSEIDLNSENIQTVLKIAKDNGAI